MIKWGVFLKECKSSEESLIGAFVMPVTATRVEFDGVFCITFRLYFLICTVYPQWEEHKIER